eukprot:3403327-Karenia_brevis.AAC.1
MNRDITFDDDETQFVALSPDYYNCEACSKVKTCVEESHSGLKATAESKIEKTETETEAEIEVESSLEATETTNFLKGPSKVKKLKRFGTRM